MFDFRRKNQFDFGFVAPSDDPDIEVVHLSRESRQGLFGESLRLVRDIFLIIVVFILFGVLSCSRSWSTTGGSWPTIPA